MAENNTGLVIVQHAIERGGLGLHIPTGDFTLTTTTLTSLPWFRREEFANNTFRNNGTTIWWPANPTGRADDIRSAGDLTKTTGALAILPANLTDGTAGSTDMYLIFHGNHPSWLIAAMNRALRRAYFQCQEPLSKKPAGAVLADAGFQKSAVTQWTESDADGGPATGFTKVATQDSENVFAGMIRARRVLNTATNGYIRQRYSVSQGSQINAFSLTRLDSGDSVDLVLWDVTNNVQIGTATEHGQEAWQFMRRLGESVPATCKIVEIRHRGEGATADFYINGSWLYEQQGRRVILDTEWDSTFKLPKLMYTELRGVSVASGVYDAQSLDLRPVPADDYSAVWNRTAANPGSIQFHTDKWFQYPLWIDGRRAHSDVDGPFTRVLTETASADLDLIVWLSLEEFFLDGRVRHPEKAAMLRLAQSRSSSLSAQFPFESAAPSVTYRQWGGRLAN